MMHEPPLQNPGVQRSARVTFPIVGRRRHEPLYDHGILMFDLNSVICLCSRSLAARLGRLAAEVVGLEVRSLLPELPFRKNTPGYNIAVCTVMFGATPRPTYLGASPGVTVPVQAFIRHGVAGDAHLFLAELRWRRSQCAGITKSMDGNPAAPIQPDDP